MKARFMLYATVLFVPANLPANAASFRLVVKEKAQVKEERARLSDIATIEAVNAPQPSASDSALMEDLVVARALLPGQTRSLRWGDIETRLAELGVHKDAYELAGARQVTIQRGATVVTAAQLRKLVEDTVGTAVQFLSTPGEITLPEGRVSLLVLNPPAAYAPTPTALSLAVLVAGNREATLTIIASFPESAKPAVAAQPADNPVTPRLKTATNQPAVHYGDLVRVVSRVGRVEVRAQGKALGEARVGERVMIAVDWTQEPLKALVTGEGSVTVH